MEDQNVLTKEEFIKELVGATLGISAMLFVTAYLESSSIANGIFWKIIRRLGIAGLGLVTMQIVDKCVQEVIDEQLIYYPDIVKISIKESFQK